MKTIKTQNVSIPVELHDWVTKKMEETKLSTPWAKVTFSSVVEHALIELRNSETQISAQKTSSKPSNISPDASAEIVKPYKRSVGGSSKAGTDRSRKTG
jgi:hypothetical protein